MQKTFIERVLDFKDQGVPDVEEMRYLTDFYKENQLSLVEMYHEVNDYDEYLLFVKNISYVIDNLLGEYFEKDNTQNEQIDIAQKLVNTMIECSNIDGAESTSYRLQKSKEGLGEKELKEREEREEREGK